MSIRELKWPAGWPRTRQKDSGSIFDRRDGTGHRRPITPDRAERLLRHELKMLGAERVTRHGGRRCRCRLFHAWRSAVRDGRRPLR